MAPIWQQPLSKLGSWLLIGTSTVSHAIPPRWESPPQHYPGHDGLDWQSCDLKKFPGIARVGLSQDAIANLTAIPALSCANLTVPADWTDHHSGTITIGITRLRSNGTKNQARGSVFYNPGGPGGSATSTVFASALGSTFFSEATREHYDIIGQDPRGIGMSTPVRCDPEIFNRRVTLFPSTEKEFERLVTRNRALGESCLERTGPVLAHLDTTNAAKDIEAIRAALGREKLNWLGLSYGTQLGGAYAELFPEKVGRMVLDGNLDHSQSESSNIHAESTTYEDVLNQFFIWCNATATKEECPFQNQNFPRIFDDLVASANESPIPAPGCTPDRCRPNVTGEEILFVVQPLGSRVSNWPRLASALNDAITHNNATTLSSPLATTETDGNFAAYAIQCVDWSHSSRPVSDIKYKAQIGSYISPHTKGATQSWSIQMTCINWPVPVSNPKHYLNPVMMAKAPPILLVNAYHDPETSFVWAVGMQEQIPSGVLLTRNGTGHTSYGLHGEATGMIDKFLVDGKLPVDNLVVQS